MTQAPAAIFKIPAESPQPAPGKSAKPSGRAKKAPAGRSPVLASGNGPRSTTAELPRLPAVSGRVDTAHNRHWLVTVRRVWQRAGTGDRP